MQIYDVCIGLLIAAKNSKNVWFYFCYSQIQINLNKTQREED